MSDSEGLGLDINIEGVDLGGSIRISKGDGDCVLASGGALRRRDLEAVCVEGDEEGCCAEVR